ncbi:molecular chaperone [Parvularcula bermudensis HTCC2503]|uniref:Anhydro-N-acetylmuramic acid kinase n=1 Tax=Parvularcula bermudensis (strain ATCC BAA-594 / HTCC2503 / KCTC 12087) TaxID=314260 RepID=E0TDX0_PARBH|nr:anhydro-N-acetylmuramic acid kinase [Parvularcula bermudensis]ADM10419.1 molecular chaperone [Parvularcula bermudensis HTCC2503]
MAPRTIRAPSPDRVYSAIGLMSGTSLDGVDVAMLRTDGETLSEFGPMHFLPYPSGTRAAVVAATKAALEGRSDAKEIHQASDLVTSAHIEAVRDFLQAHRLTPQAVDVVGFHGQTILHRPAIAGRAAPGQTLQIGDGRHLASEVQIPVVDQFRRADIANGGEGAPLAPIYHLARARGAAIDGSIAVLNIGGVANITFLPKDRSIARLMAFDCGPGNGLIDQWVSAKTVNRMDEGGKLAANGKIHEDRIHLMSHSPYLKRKPPKSLDRYDFKLGGVDGLTLEDGAATLTAFTASCVASAAAFLPEPPSIWVVVGGGRHNPVMMAALADRLPSPVVACEELGWRGDFVEAEAFAFLAVRRLKELPISFPMTTHVPRPLLGGEIHPLTA